MTYFMNMYTNNGTEKVRVEFAETEYEYGLAFEENDYCLYAFSVALDAGECMCEVVNESTGEVVEVWNSGNKANSNYSYQPNLF